MFGILRLAGAAVLSPILATIAYWAQQADSTAPQADLQVTLVTAIAGSSPFAALAIYIIISQRGDLKEEREATSALIKEVMDKVIPAQVESNRLHAETIKALETATVQAHALAGRSFSPDTMNRLLRALNRIEPPE